MQTGTLSYVKGLEGVGQFRFEGKTVTGRAIAVDVSPEVILALAEALKHTQSVGHAAWHVQQKNAAFEVCSVCSKS